MPGERDHRWLRSLLLCLCDIFRVLWHLVTSCKDAPQVEFIYLVFACMPGELPQPQDVPLVGGVCVPRFTHMPSERDHRWLRSLLLCLCDIFRVLWHLVTSCEDAPQVEFIYLVFACMPDESYRLRSLLLYLCDVFWVLINSLVCVDYFDWSLIHGLILYSLLPSRLTALDLIFVHAGYFSVSVIHPNSDMDSRIFTVRLWSFSMHGGPWFIIIVLSEGLLLRLHKIAKRMRFIMTKHSLQIFRVSPLFTL